MFTEIVSWIAFCGLLIVMYVNIGRIFALGARWDWLHDDYPSRASVDGQRWRRVRAYVGARGPGREPGESAVTLSLGVILGGQGLYLKPRLFTLILRPVLIPWSAITYVPPPEEDSYEILVLTADGLKAVPVKRDSPEVVNLMVHTSKGSIALTLEGGPAIALEHWLRELEGQEQGKERRD